MTSATQHFVALLVGILTAISLMGAGLWFLIRISFRTGQLVDRLDAHIRSEDKLNDSMDKRLIYLEQRRR